MKDDLKPIQICSTRMIIHKKKQVKFYNPFPFSTLTGRAMGGYIKQSWIAHSDQWRRKNLPETRVKSIQTPWSCTVFQAILFESIQCTNKACAILQDLGERTGAGPGPVVRAPRTRRRCGPECSTMPPTPRYPAIAVSGCILHKYLSGEDNCHVNSH